MAINPVRSCLLALCFSALSLSAHAGFIFTPHLSEYAKLPRGPYFETQVIHTQIEEVYNREGDKISVGSPRVQPGESIEATNINLKALWIGNPFRDTHIPVLNNHDQIFRIIATVSDQQASGGLVDLSEDFGLDAGNSGIGDLFLLGGIYGNSHRLGPLQFNGLFATTFKLPVGEYDQDSLLNPGTNYFTVAPQLAMHQNWFGRVLIDASAAYQFNGDNDNPAYGGLTPSEPADVYTLEANLAWKWSERLFTDVGISHRATTEPNRFENPSLNLQGQPLEPTTLREQLGVPDFVPLPNAFFLQPQAGTFEDRGVRGTLLTAGINYVYRSSLVFGARVAYPIGGKGSQFDLPYDVLLGLPTGAGGALEPGPAIPNGTQTVTVNGVQEAAAVSADPFFEIRLVYIPWAP